MASNQPGVYGPAYQRARAAMIASGARCACGARATSLDHQPPIARHAHIEGTGCCRWVPACLPCQRRQGGDMRSRRYAPPPSRAW